MSKRGFTLVELMVVLVIIAIGLTVVIEGISRSIGFLDKTKNEVIAANLAREGVEAVYQIRNTNRLRRSGAKDACRLAIDPNDCGDVWMGEESWMIIEKNNTMQRILRSGNGDPRDGENDGYYGLCQQNGKWTVCDNEDALFFRWFEARGLYSKETGNKIECTNANDTYTDDVPMYDCDDDRPKEFRFCVIVESRQGLSSSVELCGILTNFVE